jgi:hypothetical protein
MTGTALVGQVVLYRLPGDSWVRGTVAGSSRTTWLSLVVLYRPVRQHLCPRVRRGAVAARRGLARPRRSMGAPPARCALALLPLNGTAVMGLPADGPDAGFQLELE